MRRTIFVFCLLLMGVQFWSCRRDEDFYAVGHPRGPQLGDILRFISILGSPIADSVTPVQLRIQINGQAAAANRQLRLVTTGGVFSNNDTAIVLTASATGIATVSLTSEKPGLSRIRATVGETVVDTSLQFAVAFPDDMLLNANRVVLDTVQNTDSEITARLFRDTGTVSDPQKVSFLVTPDVAGTLPLQLDAFTFSDQKKATVTLTNPFKSTGWFTVTASVLRQNGDTLARSLRIRVH
jgi:hypothetical protein